MAQLGMGEEAMEAEPVAVAQWVKSALKAARRRTAEADFRPPTGLGPFATHPWTAADGMRSSSGFSRSADADSILGPHEDHAVLSAADRLRRGLLAR